MKYVGAPGLILHFSSSYITALEPLQDPFVIQIFALKTLMKNEKQTHKNITVFYLISSIPIWL